MENLKMIVRVKGKTETARVLFYVLENSVILDKDLDGIRFWNLDDLEIVNFFVDI